MNRMEETLYFNGKRNLLAAALVDLVLRRRTDKCNGHEINTKNQYGAESKPFAMKRWTVS